MLIPLTIPKAIIFDVDGTLYDQRKMRRFMLSEMAKFSISTPRQIMDLKILWDFRRLRESNALAESQNLHEQQYILAACASKVKPDKARRIVYKWMFEKPLKHLKACRYEGVKELFANLRKRNIGIGVFSEYPALKKLDALQLTPDVVVCATDKDVDRLKPDPRGLLVAASKLKTQVNECVYIGDRNDKDALCAKRAGMPYLILDTKRRQSSNGFRSFLQLNAWIERSSCMACVEFTDVSKRA